jgi:hypothetical protein
MLAYLADSRLGIGPFVRPIKASVPPHKTVTIHSELDSLYNEHPSITTITLPNLPDSLEKFELPYWYT